MHFFHEVILRRSRDSHPEQAKRVEGAVAALLSMTLFFETTISFI
jgi:hypothetical protein